MTRSRFWPPSTPAARHCWPQKPDFVYSMRASAYAPDAGGVRGVLAKLGIPAYLSSNDCEDPKLIPASVTFEGIFGEIGDIAKIFGVQDRGESVVAGLRERLDAAKDTARSGLDKKLMWYYSGTKTPAIAGRGGLPNTISGFLGVGNAFSDIAQQWSEGSWEKIAERDPDVIVLADLTRGGEGDSPRRGQDEVPALRSRRLPAHSGQEQPLHRRSRIGHGSLDQRCQRRGTGRQGTAGPLRLTRPATPSFDTTRARSQHDTHSPSTRHVLIPAPWETRRDAALAVTRREDARSP